MWGRLNAAEIGDNWRLSTRSVANLALSQVYHTERPVARSPCCSASRGVCQRQLILPQILTWVRVQQERSQIGGSRCSQGWCPSLLTAIVRYYDIAVVVVAKCAQTCGSGQVCLHNNVSNTNFCGCQKQGSGGACEIGMFSNLMR